MLRDAKGVNATPEQLVEMGIRFWFSYNRKMGQSLQLTAAV
jgi:hypothetical protein